MRRNATTDAMEKIDAMISVTNGPQVFETTNCAVAKLPPATSATGQERRKPAHPATSTARYAGKRKDKNGSFRPTIAESFARSKPVTPAKAMMGTPNAPKATGAVLATRETTTA